VKDSPPKVEYTTPKPRDEWHTFDVVELCIFWSFVAIITIGLVVYIYRTMDMY
jgi:hypothetical protein